MEMRVALVANFQIEFAAQLANALAAKADVALVVWEKLARDSLELVNPRVTVIRAGEPGRSIPNRLWNQFRTTVKISDLEPDVIHFQNAYLWGVPSLPLLPDARVIVSIHDPFPHQGVPDPRSFPAIAANLARADGIVLMGRSQLEVFRRRFSLQRKRVAVIPHGEFSFYQGYGPIPESDGHTVLFIGRIAQYKGLEFFLEAAKQVGMKRGDITFRVVGAGDISIYRDRIVNAGNVEVTNRFVSSKEFLGEIGRSLVVVAPYTQASQSGVIVAAQSLGRPVIATHVGGLADDVLNDRTGLVVQPRDAQGLADAVLSLADDKKKCTEMGRAGREWMATERGWSRIADLTLQFYEDSA